MEMYKPNEFAKMIGVSVKTLQRWDNSNKLIAFRAPSNRRYYTHNQDLKRKAKPMLRRISLRTTRATGLLKDTGLRYQPWDLLGLKRRGISL